MGSGPHNVFEMASKGFKALSPQVVNNTTLPTTGGQELGFDIRGFNGDLLVICDVGVLPTGADIDFTMQDAPEDTDGTVPETGDFVAALDSAGAAITLAFDDTEDNTYKIMRIDRHLLDAFVRIRATNAHASAALLSCFMFALDPAYEKELGERVQGSLTVFK